MLDPARGRARRAWLEGLGLLAVLGLAAFTRLHGLEYTPFKGDQAEWFLQAQDMVEGRLFPTAGMSTSIGWVNAPLAVYLFALAYLLAPDALGVTTFVAVANILGVAALYGAARATWGHSVALLASGMLALVPGAVHFGRFIWNPDLVPPMASLALWGLLAHVRGRRWGMPLAVFAFLWAAQLHAFNLLEAPGLILAWWVGGWRTSPKGFTLAITAGAAPLAPYIYRYVQERPSLPTGTGVLLDTQALEGAVSLLNPAYWTFLAGVPPSSVDLGIALAVLLLAAGWLGLWWTGTRAGSSHAETPSGKAWSIPALWGLAPPVLATVHVFPPHGHYQVGILPALCLLLAVAISRAGGMAGLRASMTAAAMLLVAGSYALGFAAYLDTVRRNEVGRDYGAPLTYTRQAAEALARLMREQPEAAPWTYVASRLDMRRTVDAFLDRQDVAEAWSDHSLVLPPPGQPGLFLMTEDGTPTAALLKEIYGDALITVTGPAHRPAYSLYGLPPDAADRLDGPEWRGLAHRLGNAAAFDAFKLPERAEAGTELVVGLRWRVTGPGAEVPSGASTFAVLVDHQERPWGDEAHDLREPTHWRVGELVLDWHRIAVDPRTPSGRYWVLVGIDRGGRLALSDSRGQPSGTAMRLGPLRVVGQTTAAPTPEIVKAGAWEDGILLEGLDPPRIQSGDGLSVRLYWRSRWKPQHSYTAFVHLVDPLGRLIAQSDGLPQDGLLPTDFWLPGELVVDERRLAVPASARPGEFRLQVGWYRPETGQRLSMKESPGLESDFLDLGSFHLP